MAEAELETFTSIMDALVRISVSTKPFLWTYLFQFCVRISNTFFPLDTQTCTDSVCDEGMRGSSAFGRFLASVQPRRCVFLDNAVGVET